MCIFSQTCTVASTMIFARLTPFNTQLLAYKMDFLAADDLAMILPLPVPVPSSEDSVRFIDFSGYADFFEDVAAGFPVPKGMAARSRVTAHSDSILAVHNVGEYEASFVPSIAAFRRLDHRFRLSEKVWKKLPSYADYGFAVFKLRGTAKQRSVHPMVFEFPTRHPATVFYPTVHIHDGELHDDDNFDHTLFAQGGPDIAYVGWERSDMDTDQFVHVNKTLGVVCSRDTFYKRTLRGIFKNTDVWVPAPEQTDL